MLLTVAKLCQAMGIIAMMFTFVDSFFLNAGYLKGEYFLFFFSIAIFYIGRFLEKKYQKNINKKTT